MTVCPVSMRGVKRVIPEHVLGFFWQVFTRRLIDVFIMPKGKVDLIESTVRLVDSILGLVVSDFAIRVGGEEFRKDNLIRVGAAHGEGVTHHCPLGLAV